MTRLKGAASFLTYALDLAIERAFFLEENATYVRRTSTPARTAGVAMPPTATPAPDPR